MMSNDELKPAVKIVGWPVILLMWCIHRLLHVKYVNSQSFTEYLEEL